MGGVGNASITIEKSVNFQSSKSSVTFQALEDFYIDELELLLGTGNITMDHITYRANSTSPTILNFSISSTLKKFINMDSTTSINISFYNLSLDDPYNDIYNQTGGFSIIGEANNYNLIIGPGDEIRIGEYLVNTTTFSEAGNTINAVTDLITPITSLVIGLIKLFVALFVILLVDNIFINSGGGFMNKL